MGVHESERVFIPKKKERKNKILSATQYTGRKLHIEEVEEEEC